MKKKATAVFLTLAISLGFALVWAANPEYVGSLKCKVCHKEQHKIWDSKKHSKAWAFLTPEEQNNPECIECHSTGNFAERQGVGCEVCHGPGSEFSKPDIMNKAKWAANPEGQLKLALAAGLIPEPGEELCIKCHNKNSPAFEDFDFDEAKEEIKHWK